MPWLESSPMSERLAFVTACLNRRESIATICGRFGISEKTGYKLLARVKRDGLLVGVAERSHAWHTHPQQMATAVATQILSLRQQHPRWGPVKLRDWLVQHHPDASWPAPSSIGALLQRAGLTHPLRRRDPRHATLTTARTAADTPNAVWTADFKGQFRMGTGPYCFPLTVMDRHSRYVLGCEALASTAVHSTRAVFRQLFRTYGLPRVIRTDNGVPFAQPNALGRLGSLAWWWIRLGIRPEHTAPAAPQENGAHERFHKTLKAETTRPPAASLRAQQQRFDAFLTEYNTERPHASLPGHVPPAQCYTPSLRPYPVRVGVPAYPAHADLRLVSSSGTIKVQNAVVTLSLNLRGETVHLLPTDAEQFTVVYRTLALGEFDCHLRRFVPHVRWLEALAPHP